MPRFLKQLVWAVAILAAVILAYAMFSPSLSFSQRSSLFTAGVVDFMCIGWTILVFKLRRK